MKAPLLALLLSGDDVGDESNNQSRTGLREVHVVFAEGEIFSTFVR